ncbi:SUMF1/EgtB/PvdO family nonheme iron enzyme [Luminiphilus sp.]|nr:SUMF1/EgtB/PvdO family nonheme iron enzyme [Luminiphilus sp.]
MEADLLAQIDSLRRRRKFRAVAIIVMLPLVVAIAAAMAMSKVYQIKVYPRLLPDTPANIEIVNGAAIHARGRLILFTTEAEIEFSYPGHKSFSVKLVKDDATAIVQTRLRPKPKSLQLLTSPSTDVSWIVGATLIGSGASRSVEISPNQAITVEAIGPFGQVATETVEIDWRHEGQSQLVIDLSDWAIDIASTPGGATVYSGEKQLGSTPLRIFPTSQFGDVVVEKPGFQPRTIRLSSFANRPDRSIMVRLEPSVRNIAISLAPIGGQITGGILSEDGRRFIPTQPLPQQVTYSKTGYVAESVTVGSTTTEVSFDLKPATGVLAVKTPFAARLSIGGQGVYALPGEIKLPVGKFSAIVNAEGFQPLEFEVVILQDETTRVEPNLESLSDYRARTARPREQGPLGIYLTKVTGSFFMLGAPRSERGQRANEIIRDVEFRRDFYISELEISEKQFARFSSNESSSNLPVTGVTWEQAAQFCNQLSKLQGLPPFYKVSGKRIVGWEPDSVGYRLPTEAEWEFVAANFMKRKKTSFVWGDDFEIPETSFGNIADKSAEGKAKKFISDRSDGHGGRAPVGFSKQVGNISDLSGNVSEWVHDFYSISASRSQPLIDYQGPSNGRQHFVKGSNYLSSSWTELRASYREAIDGSREDVGFRIARYVY